MPYVPYYDPDRYAYQYNAIMKVVDSWGGDTGEMGDIIPLVTHVMKKSTTKKRVADLVEGGLLGTGGSYPQRYGVPLDQLEERERAALKLDADADLRRMPEQMHEKSLRERGFSPFVEDCEEQPYALTERERRIARRTITATKQAMANSGKPVFSAHWSAGRDELSWPGLGFGPNDADLRRQYKSHHRWLEKLAMAGLLEVEGTQFGTRSKVYTISEAGHRLLAGEEPLESMPVNPTEPVAEEPKMAAEGFLKPVEGEFERIIREAVETAVTISVAERDRRIKELERELADEKAMREACWNEQKCESLRR